MKITVTRKNMGKLLYKALTNEENSYCLESTSSKEEILKYDKAVEFVNSFLCELHENGVNLEKEFKFIEYHFKTSFQNNDDFAEKTDVSFEMDFYFL